MFVAAAIAVATYLPTTAAVTPPQRSHQAPRWTQQQARYRWRGRSGPAVAA